MFGQFLSCLAYRFQDSKMNQGQSGKMTLRVAPDVRRALETWAQQNLSTMTTEVNRCIRECMRRERERAESAAEVR
jgi:hypothetical protein